ncbi:MAG: flippase-like domain-containing protein, partial [Armatimonadetes bacterium]|nr:flippase-like domain-containing protein [Armatimonadota bacterium]
MKLLVKLAVTAGFLAVAFSQVSMRELAALLQQANPWLLLAAVLIGLLGCAVNARKWQMLLGAAGVAIAWRRAMTLYMVGYFLNNIFTGMGEVKRIYDVGRSSGNGSAVLVSVFLERWTGIVAQASVSLAALSVATLTVPGLWGVAAMNGLGLAMLVVLYMVAVGAPAARGVARLVERYPRLNHYVARAHDALQEVRGRNVLRWALLQSVLVAGLLIVMHVALGLALGLSVRGDFALVVPLAVAFGQVPVSVNGLGIQEVGYLALFGAVGLLPAQAM